MLLVMLVSLLCALLSLDALQVYASDVDFMYEIMVERATTIRSEICVICTWTCPRHSLIDPRVFQSVKNFEILRILEFVNKGLVRSILHLLIR